MGAKLQAQPTPLSSKIAGGFISVSVGFMFIILIAFIILTIIFTLVIYEFFRSDNASYAPAYRILLLMYIWIWIIIIWIVYVIKTQVRSAISSIKLTNYYDSKKGVVHGLAAGVGLTLFGVVLFRFMPSGGMFCVIGPAIFIVLFCTVALVLIYFSKARFEYNLDFEKALQSPELDDYEEELIKVLNSKSSHLRSDTIMALEELGSPAAFEALVAVLTDPDPEVAAEAAEALGTLGDPKALVPLLKCTTAQDKRVRAAAQRAIEAIRDKRRVGFLVK